MRLLLSAGRPIELKKATFSISLYGGFIYGVCEPKNRTTLLPGMKALFSSPAGSFIVFINRAYENTIELVGGVEILKGFLTKRQFYSSSWNGFEEVRFDSETYMSPETKTFVNPLGREIKYAVIYRSATTTIPQHKCRIGWRLKLPEAGINASIRTIRINPSGAFNHEIGVVNKNDNKYYMKASSTSQTTWDGAVYNLNISASDNATAIEVRILNYQTSFTGGTFYYGGYWVREATFYVQKTTMKQVLEYEAGKLNLAYAFVSPLDDTYEYKDEEPFGDFAQACEVFARLTDSYFVTLDKAIYFGSLSGVPEFSVKGGFSESLITTYNRVEQWNNPVPSEFVAQGELLGRANSVLSRTEQYGATLRRALDFDKISRMGDSISTANVNSFIKKAWVQEEVQSLTLEEVYRDGKRVKAGLVPFPFALNISGEPIIPVAVEYHYPENFIVADLSNILMLRRR